MDLVCEEGRGSQEIKQVKESWGHIAALTGIRIANVYPALSACVRICVFQGWGNKRGKVTLSRQDLAPWKIGDYKSPTGELWGRRKIIQKGTDVNIKIQVNISIYPKGATGRKGCGVISVCNTLPQQQRDLSSGPEFPNCDILMPTVLASWPFAESPLFCHAGHLNSPCWSQHCGSRMPLTPPLALPPQRWNWTDVCPLTSVNQQAAEWVELPFHTP